MHTSRLAHPAPMRLAAAVLAAVMTLSACSSGSGTTPAADVSLPQAEHTDITTTDGLEKLIPATVDLADPRTLEGISVVGRMREVEPVTTDPKPQLPVELTDADGHDVTVTDTSRILALDIYGTYTKTLRGLGLSDHIVGRTVSSDEESLADLPVVTPGGHTINVEAVLNLKPTLVIVDHSIGPPQAIEQIRQAGVTVVVMAPKHTLDSVAEDIENVAGVVGLPEEGKKLAERSVAEVNSAKAAIATIVPDKPLRVAFLYARGTGGIFYFLGRGTGAQDLIQGVGGVDVAAENNLGEATPAGAESLPKLNPDVFFMMEEGLTSTGGIDGLLARPGVAQTTAGQHRRVVAIPDGQSLAFGPQSGELLLRVALALYVPSQKTLSQKKP